MSECVQFETLLLGRIATEIDGPLRPARVVGAYRSRGTADGLILLLAPTDGGRMFERRADQCVLERL